MKNKNNTTRDNLPINQSRDLNFASFKKTMSQTRGDLPLVNKALSIIMHSKYIEFTASFFKKIFFRPYQLLLGSSLALIASLISVALINKYGYNLSGSEYAVAFGIGWIFGSLIEFFISLSKKM